MQMAQGLPPVFRILPVLMVVCIIVMRLLRHSSERAEQREETVRGNSFVCEYRKHGGMEDAFLLMKLVSDADGVKLFVGERLPDAEETEDVYPLPANAADPLIDIYFERGVWKWGELKQSEVFALDSSIYTVRFNTAIGETRFGSNDELPKSGEGIIIDVYDYLNSWRSVFRGAAEQKQ
ncbi:MAG: hypothetical protein IJL83_01545 [Clostridia bacterium]|nr:hypothetical protein [Clostridia bacterium]